MPGSNIPTNNLPNADDNISPSIEVINQQSLDIDIAKLKQVALEIMVDHACFETEISIAIVDDPTIHDLNVRYLQHDYETDVLSFPLGRDVATGYVAGEVIASADTAKRIAEELATSYKDELLLYVIHGLLHLLGYDDKQADNRQKMRQKERLYMERAGAHYQPPEDPESPSINEAQS